MCDRYRNESDACIGCEDRYQVGYCGDGGGKFFIGYVALDVDHYRLQNEVGYKGECYVDQYSDPEKRGTEQSLRSCFFNRFILCHFYLFPLFEKSLAKTSKYQALFSCCP